MKKKDNLQILLVEDEAITAQYMKTGLNKRGHIVNTVATGKKAIEFATKTLPDLIIMDIHLAGELNGIETIQAIYTSSIVPVIFITGYVDEVIKEKTASYKTLAFMVKPVNINDIVAVIDSEM